MTMTEFMEKEIEIYKQKHYSFQGRCADTALKAYMLIKESGHSDLGSGIVVDLLTRMLKELPLTPITDEDFPDAIVLIGGDGYLRDHNLEYSIPCRRMDSLYKEKTLDGKVSYTDTNRFVCYDEKDPKFAYICNKGERVVDKMFPITMPYYPPTKKYVVMFRGSKPIWVETPEGEKVMVEE